MNHIYITTYVMFIFWSKLKRKLFKISNLINICCQQLIKGICNFFICLSIFAHWIKLVSISLNWDFCLEYGFIIEWNFLFYLVEIFVQTMVSLLSQSQTSFLLSWNEAQTGFFLSNPQHHVIILNRDLFTELDLGDFSNKLEFLPELRSFYRIRIAWLFQ